MLPQFSMRVRGDGGKYVRARLLCPFMSGRADGFEQFPPAEEVEHLDGHAGPGRVRIIGERGPLRVKVHAFGGRWA